jgi:hypothetical protein
MCLNSGLRLQGGKPQHPGKEICRSPETATSHLNSFDVIRTVPRTHLPKHFHVSRRNCSLPRCCFQCAADCCCQYQYENDLLLQSDQFHWCLPFQGSNAIGATSLAPRVPTLQICSRTALINQLHQPSLSIGPALFAGLIVGGTSVAAFMRPVLEVELLSFGAFPRGVPP